MARTSFSSFFSSLSSFSSSTSTSYFFFSFFFVLLKKWYKKLNQPQLRLSPLNFKLLNLISLTSSLQEYLPPPFFFDYYGHFHTFLNHIIRNKKKPLQSCERELFVLDDKGTIALDWIPNKPTQQQQQGEQENKPIVILIHGLCE